jgi:hypothetical protein
MALLLMCVVSLDFDPRQLRQEALRGQVSVEQLLDVIGKQQQTIQNLRREYQRLQDRLARYEPEVRREGSSSTSSTETPSSSYSLDAEEKRRRSRKRRRNRRDVGRPS